METETRIADAAAAIVDVLPKAFQGDAHALLMSVYKNSSVDLALRLDAAKAAIRYERPALSSIDQTQVITLETTVRQPSLINPRDLSYEQRAQLRDIVVTAIAAQEAGIQMIEGPES